MSSLAKQPCAQGSAQRSLNSGHDPPLNESNERDTVIANLRARIAKLEKENLVVIEENAILKRKNRNLSKEIQNLK